MSVARTAIVTGAARGIGAAIAARFAEAGWRPVLLDRDGSGEQTAAAIGSGARYLRVDVSDESAIAEAVDDVCRTEGRLDALVCNAGFMIRKPLASLTLVEWNKVIATNLTSTFLLARAAEAMLRVAKGSIVTIASTRAKMSEPDTESYSATKGGLVALSHSLAISLGPDIRVNCVSPGWIDTQGHTLRPEDHAQHPAGRVGIPQDVASLVVWLAGEQSGFVTGSEFVIDGGMTRKMIYAE